ncbi:hypothetical protein KC19_7G135000 [Ceratodon purpureus]|uniref:Uncharacterized protein n=1 Tax=Ceratodon purpureus TaxID=3225 RepID=A0A8T0H9T3_CERPU|nr:hypothetical protein KC19_7G135000 [Ceratodon purpureus]
MALLVSRCFVVGSSPVDVCKGRGIALGPLLTGGQLLTSGGSRGSFCYRRLSVRCRSRERPEGATRQRGQKQELRRNALQLYRSRFAAALTAELEEELEAMKKRLRQWPKQRLQNEGFALFDLSVRADGRLYRDLVFRFSSPQERGGLLPSQHQFSHGDMVVISRKNPLDDEDTVIEGVVMERARRFLRVAIPSYQAKGLNVSLKWRLDLSANRVSYERCMLAINCFASPELRQGLSGSLVLPTAPVASPNSSKNSTKSEKSITVGEGTMAVRGLIMGVEETKSRLGEGTTLESLPPDTYINQEYLSIAKSPPSRISGKMFGAHKGSVRALLQGMGNEINNSQKIAIEAAFNQRITLWQGPPGTGKTRTLVRLITAFCRNKQGQVLACADSNVAVDNLLEGLLDQGLRVVRVGQPVKVKEMLRDATLDAQLLKHPLMLKAAESRQAAILQRQETRQINNSKKRISSAKQATSMWQDSVDLESQAIKDILDKADVITATCVGSGDDVLEDRRFRLCVIDEATQATEPSCLIPLMRSGADSVVLVGDPAQLPPTVISQEAIETGLAVSLFEHIQQCGVTPYLLDTQYRMHPAVAAWPSQTFYGGRLVSQPSPSDRPAPKGLTWPNTSKPLCFVDCVDGEEETTTEGYSWRNRQEANLVMNIVERLISDPDISGDIGVIAPYAAQVRLLRDLLLILEKQDPGKFINVEVATVDGFQGREKEVIVFSTVRCNKERRLGFVTDPRRMNVAFTRARRGLVVVGSSSTLSSNNYWASWLKYMRDQRLVLDSSASLATK